MRIRKFVDPDYAGIFYRKEKYEHDPELMEAYECGRKDGYREAMEEAEEYHERRGNTTHYGGDGSRILYRDSRRGRSWSDDDDDYSERRRRDSRGRYM